MIRVTGSELASRCATGGLSFMLIVGLALILRSLQTMCPIGRSVIMKVRPSGWPGSLGNSVMPTRTEPCLRVKAATVSWIVTPSAANAPKIVAAIVHPILRL